MQSNPPAWWRCCRLQLLAFVLLHLLGSCSRPTSTVNHQFTAIYPSVCSLTAAVNQGKSRAELAGMACLWHLSRPS